MDTPELYNLATDIGEDRDQSSSRPKLMNELLAKYKAWSDRLESPRWTERHTQNTLKERAAAKEAGTRQSPMPWIDR